MLLFSIPVLFVLLSVSDAANSGDYGLVLDSSEGNLRRFNRQKHPDFTEIEDGSDQKPKPCPDRRSMNDQLIYQDAPVGIAPDSSNQWKSVMPVPIRNEEVQIPSERILPTKQSQQVQKVPEELSQSPRITQVTDNAPPRIHLRVPVKNTEHVTHIVPEEIDNQTGISSKKKPQLTQNYNLDTSFSRKSSSEEIPEHIIRHNEDVPSHEEHLAIFHVPVQNKTTEPNSFFDLVHLPNSKETLAVREKPTPPKINVNSHIITTLKPKTKHINFAAPGSCNLKLDEPSDDILPHSRRSMTQDPTVKPVKEKLPNYAHTNEKPHQNLLKRISEDGEETNRYSPSSPYPSNQVPLRSVGYVTPTATFFQEPTLMEPTYQLSDPTKGMGIAPLSDIRGHMMQSSKVCYACSTLSDASCWFPDRTTTVKYCRPGHDVCVTKTFRSTSAADLIVIRDCSSACDVNTPGLDTHYDSCAVCKEDLCNNIYIENSAFSFSPINSIFILLCTALIKYVF